MDGKMRAVVAHAKGDYRYETVDIPAIGAEDLLLKVEACGVCAGDVKCFEGGFRFWGGEGNPAYAEPPFIPGHEIIGRVAALGAAYAGEFAVGDRVAVEQIVPCGACRYCREGKYWLCDPHDVFGFKHYLNGGFAEYARMPKNARLYRIPEDMPIEQAALIEPYACGLHAVDRARIEPEDVVIIAGAGTLGLSMVAAARMLNPRALISIDPVAKRRALALAMGADHAMDAWPHAHLPEFLHDLSEGVGCDVYIEAAGHIASIQQGLNLIKKGGRFVEFSVFSGPASIDWSIIGDAKELDLYGVSLSPDCFPRAIDGIASGKLKTAGVVTQALPLEEFKKAFAAGADGGVKTILIP
ncbi:MAG: alcohol dehydrogenase catalytic domain-containing protein [Christensenellales bacterium]|jgi:threonine dehydrogenase-like Zn-dependent dehydrogenase